MAHLLEYIAVFFSLLAAEARAGEAILSCVPVRRPSLFVLTLWWQMYWATAFLVHFTEALLNPLHSSSSALSLCRFYISQFFSHHNSALYCPFCPSGIKETPWLCLCASVCTCNVFFHPSHPVKCTKNPCMQTQYSSQQHQSGIKMTFNRDDFLAKH